MENNNDVIDKTKLSKALSAVSDGNSFKIKRNLNILDLLQLKDALKGVNNSITSLLTEKFIEFLFEQKLISIDSKKIAIDRLKTISPNSNGYDVVIDKEKIIGEIKSNILFKNSYGSKQIESIEKDLASLYDGKSKEKLNPKLFYKFMVLLDYEHNGISTKDAFNKLLDAKDKLHKENRKIGDIYHCEFYSNAKRINKECIYIIFIK